MHTLPASHFTAEDIAQLEQIVEAEGRPNVRQLIAEITCLVRSGEDIHFLSDGEELTPNEAAKKLKMSRTHLCKLLDRGEIPSYQVGTHRRIRARDLALFDNKRRADRNELAEMFFHQGETIRAADQSIANFL
ncbi:helix-turn-helix domain-containing protein [Corynebacterium sp. CCUG 51687]|uniref:helix-turn-helix domain-containing protein n=1 Tax=Corynebacterium TaxID=1716 RepID=UPI002108AF47|nr:helix-turn-helix domain-containing protein [Corynebacterium sp. CCUG 51687]MCQ4613088.1 excisionase family DNA-binding protein [Corynebacterium sp. CCUG 51687]